MSCYFNPFITDIGGEWRGTLHCDLANIYEFALVVNTTNPMEGTFDFIYRDQEHEYMVKGTYAASTRGFTSILISSNGSHPAVGFVPSGLDGTVSSDGQNLTGIMTRDIGNTCKLTG
ncbi:unnamed protein product, partial [Owenia fusiformis]